MTALGEACANGFLDIAKLLMDHNGDPTKIDRVFFFSFSLIESFWSSYCIFFSQARNSGLHEAAFGGHIEIVKYLLETGSCDIDAKNEVFFSNTLFQFSKIVCPEEIL